MKDYELYVFDLDGVLYRGSEVIPGAPAALNRLRERGKKVRFLTNNGSETREARMETLRMLGFDAEPSEIYTSALGTAKIIANSRAFVVGEHGLRTELLRENVELTSKGNPTDWVVVGICWTFDFAMLEAAQDRIFSGARFIATNRDATFPDSGGRIRPGAGAIVAAVAAAAQTEPQIVVGKPSPMLLKMIMEDAGVGPSECVLVGDRGDTDLVCASRAGCDSILVMTGVTSDSDIENLPAPASMIVSSVSEIE